MPQFEDLEIWKRSARLSAEVYKGLATLNDYGFKDQITRSGLSVPSNIAEGMERASSKEKIRFLDIAKGSAAELRTQIYIGMDIGYIKKETGRNWLQETKELSAMIVGLCNALKES
jgi:four helix bundle protein